MSNHPLSKYLPTKSLMQRYGVCDRTIDRWVELNIIPKPTYINRRRYWDAVELDEFDAARKAVAA